MKTKQKKPAGKSIDQKYYGNEPIKVDTSNFGAYSDALNWYNYMFEHDKAREWLLEYMKKSGYQKSQIADIRKCPKYSVPTTIGWQARMMMNGNKLTEKSMDFFNQHLDRLFALANSVIEDSPKADNVVSIQDRVKKANSRIIAEAEAEVIDERGSMYEFLQARQATPAVAKKMLEYYQRIYDEVMSDDEQVKEAYGKRLKSERAFIQSVVDDLNRYIGNKKAVKVRKPRAKKTKSVVDLVKNVKYQKEFPALKIVSVNPTEIIGASQVWVYNTKYRKLTQYVSQSPTGLGVKGTTLTGWDTELSVSKSIRSSQSEKLIQQLLSSGKVALRTFLSSIKTSSTSPNGRVNECTVILRVVK